MSDKVDTAVRDVEEGRVVTRPVNEGMSREEQLDFARRLWSNGGTAEARGGKTELTKIVGDAEVTFRRGQDGEREVSDIVFRGTKDLYDTPEQARARAAQAHSDRAAGPRTTTPGTGAVADTRYREAPASGDKPSSTDTRPQSVIDRLRAQRNQAGHFNVNQQRMLEEI